MIRVQKWILLFEDVFALFPFLILVVFLIKIDSKGPIFYLQSRVGKNGHLFKVYKFRTMTNKQRDPNAKQTFWDDPDITRIGGLLRRFKIDELPQIWMYLSGICHWLDLVQLYLFI